MPTKTLELTRNGSKATQHLPVKSDRKVVLLRVDDIDWIGSAHNHVAVRVGKQSHRMRGTLDSVELRLPTDKFVRISRFSIVQIDRIKELELFNSGDYRVTLHNGTKLLLSRRYRGNFRRRGLL